MLSHLCSQSYRSSPTSVLIFFSPRLSKFSFFIIPLPAHSSVLIVIPHLRTLFSPVPSQSSILSVLSHLRIHSDRSSSTTVFLVFVFSSLILPSVFQFSYHFRGTLFNLYPRSCQSLVTSVLIHLNPWSQQSLVISVLGHLNPWSPQSLVISVLGHLSHWSSQSLVISVLGHLSPWSSQYLVISVLGHLSP